MRLTVEDVFVIRNRGVVATGRIESGTLREGDTVHINGGPGVHVEGVEMFRKPHAEASVGDNVGVLMRSIDKGDVTRGDVLTSSGEVHPL